VIEIVVIGSPAPQGSKKFVGMRGGHGVMIESSKAVKPWREAVKWAAHAARNGAPPLDGALIVRMVFTMPKPQSAPKTRRTYPNRKPDISKLIRSTEDALTDAGIWVDDSRVVGYERAEKVFPGEDPEALDVPGVRIVIRDIAEASQQVARPLAVASLF
jgi:Holliday junction resolvase RusA-like endonuclease